MTCAHVRQQLQDFLDGRLGEPMGRQVARHVASCARCERELELYRRIASALETDSAPDVDLTDAIMARLSVEGRAPVRRVWRAWVAAAAAILAVVAAGLAAPRRLYPGTLVEPLAARASELGRDWLAPSTDELVNLSRTCAAAAESTWDECASVLIASVSYPHVPLLVVLAACVVAVAVNVCCLRGRLPTTRLGRLVL